MYIRKTNRKVVHSPWQDRLWSYINKADDDRCWEWLGGKNKLGYGTFSRDGRTCLAHRLAWETVNGPIPKGLCSLHKCDNPPCCRPDHLFIGKNADNVADRHKKGRSKGGSLVGENHPRSKLTTAQTLEIRKLYQHKNRIELSKRFGVGPKTLEAIAHGRSRKKVMETK